MSELAKNMLVKIGIICVFGIILGFILFPGISEGLSFMYGILIGMVVSIFRVFSIERAVTKAIEKDEARAKVYANAQYLLRMIIVGAMMVIAAINHPFINIWGLLFGVSSGQISFYLYGIQVSKQKK